VKPSPSVTARRLGCAVSLFLVILLSCDDDPAAPPPFGLSIVLASPDTVIGLQEAIRVRIVGAFDSTSVVNPENFVVIDQCTGLRVPGAIRLEGDVVAFSPSVPLQFLTPLSVRIQNILDVQGRAAPGPAIFRLITEAPPVTDISWELLNSPTNASVTGISFVDRERGYITNNGGEVFRTDNGGSTFAALFKRLDVRATRGIRAASADTVFVLGATNLGGTSFTTAALFRSTDAGMTFSAVYTANPADFRSLSLRRRATAHPLLFFVGNTGSLAAWRYDAQTGAVIQFGPVGGDVIGQGGDLSRDLTKALAVGQNSTGSTGFAFRSVDSARTFVPVALPANTRSLRGAGFTDDNSALLLGDSSTVLRLNVVTGEVTALGAAQGIPQTAVDNATGSVSIFTFVRAEFPPNSNGVGWIIGFVTTATPTPPNILRGVILISRDGGQTFVRQAVRDAPDNGLGFPPATDIQALSNEFAAVSGGSGFVAARKADEVRTTAACAFSRP
jgi:hypothetical protein